MEITLRERVALQQSKDQAERRFKAVFIQAGTSLNGNFYSADVLKEAAPLVKPALKMYLDHLDNPRSIRDLAGLVVGKSSFKEEALVGEILILDSKLLEKAQKSPDSIGLSINAVGDVEFVAGKKIVKRIKKIKSIDFVAEPSAGGALLPLLASMPESLTFTEEENVKKETEKVLQERLDTELDNSHRDEIQALKEKLKEAKNELSRLKQESLLKEGLAKYGLPETALSRISQRLKESDGTEVVEKLLMEEADYLACAKPEVSLKMSDGGRMNTLQSAFDKLHRI